MPSLADPYAGSSLGELQRRLAKNPPADIAALERFLRQQLREANALGPQLSPGAKILDVGCGIGDSVEILSALGYDASGIDVVEFWGRDFDKFWEDRPRPQGPTLSKLHVVDSGSYKIPFQDGHFDFAISSQVFEHVFNYEDVFREIARVLKTGAISIHTFPGPHNWMEGHINVPIPWLCYWKPYLALWALLGRRSERQAGFEWRETLALNVAQMRFCNYPTLRTLYRHARNAGVRIEFVAMKSLAHRQQGRFFRALSVAPRPLRKLVLMAGAARMQRCMVIYGGRHVR